MAANYLNQFKFSSIHSDEQWVDGIEIVSKVSTNFIIDISIRSKNLCFRINIYVSSLKIIWCHIVIQSLLILIQRLHVQCTSNNRVALNPSHCGYILSPTNDILLEYASLIMMQVWMRHICLLRENVVLPTPFWLQNNYSWAPYYVSNDERVFDNKTQLAGAATPYGPAPVAQIC